MAAQALSFFKCRLVSNAFEIYKCQIELPVQFAAFFLKETCDKTMSIVKRQKPHWISGSITSATCVKSRLNIILAKILPPTDNSEMP